MALSKNKIASIRVSYEHGIETIRALAQRHEVAPSTIVNLAKKCNWERGKTAQKTNKKIEKRAQEKLVRKESDKLANFTEKHLSDIDVVRGLSRLNLNNLESAANEAAENESALHREVCENFFSFQKVLKITSETLTNCYREERLAMGLDKDKEAKQPIIKIVNFADVDDTL